ncbi:hypothetical protein G9A89_004488 [Geosiphon pyriformis]|nr:hypothetical protein G9A89_004488 [Geosiphon pyriformis]
MDLEFTLPVFAPAPVMALASQMAATSFTPQQLSYQRQQNHSPPVCYYCELTGHFSRDCNNPLLPSLGKSTSQPEKNPFYAFNLTNDVHNIDELAINTSESTRKKKKAKVDFVLDPNKAFKSTADNNKPPKAKVFKNLPKLELPEIVQKSGTYFVVKNLMEIPAHIIFGQLTGLSVIEAARQNILATFPLKNISEKLLLAASGLFSSLVKVSSKNTLGLQQAVATTMVIPNFFVVPDEILDKIFTAAATPNMKQDQPLAVLSDMMEIESSVSPPVSDVADDGAWININGQQRFSEWVASTLVSGVTFKIKMALLISQDAVKLFCVEFASQKCLTGATKRTISDEIFLTTLKIAWSSGIVSVFFSSLSIILHNVLLDISFDDIKTALGIFGVVTSVKLKPAGL